ncbi:MAG: hypothetical protein H6Q23_1627 [Bacteroidetes bacterium]|nr:hypothetical protein [Bacteroidota bacterium]
MPDKLIFLRGGKASDIKRWLRIRKVQGIIPYQGLINFGRISSSENKVAELIKARCEYA